MDAVLIIGRILFALIFINLGAMHLIKLEAMTGHFTFKKVPLAKLSVVLSGLAALIGGLYILFGVYADLGALLIAVFLIPRAFMAHAFWKESDASAKATESSQFFQDLSLAGAALILFVLIATGVDFGPSITSSFFNF